jgi:hypothetical protein
MVTRVKSPIESGETLQFHSMNPSTTQPPFPAPALKLARRVVTPVEPAMGSVDSEQSRQLQADLAELREREANLKEYEARLRAWQDQLDADVVLPKSSPVRAPTGGAFSNNADLQAAWEKFHRAHALLEAEQRQIRIDRIISQENEASVQRRETELAAREALLAEGERRLLEAAARPIEAAEGDGKGPSAIERFTQAPFLSVFKKAK